MPQKVINIVAQCRVCLQYFTAGVGGEDDLCDGCADMREMDEAEDSTGSLDSDNQI